MEAKDKLLRLYGWAIANGLVENRKQFASLIHTAEGTLSNSLKGVAKYESTAQTLVVRAIEELTKAGVAITDSNIVGDGNVQNVSGSNNTIGVPPKNFIHEQEWFMLVAEKDKQINRLLTIIERLK